MTMAIISALESRFRAMRPIGIARAPKEGLRRSAVRPCRTLDETPYFWEAMRPKMGNALIAETLLDQIRRLEAEGRL